MANSSPAKLSVECPHCGFKQMEYAAAKSTMCRQCGGAFAPADAPKPEFKLRAREAKAPAPAAAPAETSASLPGASFLQKFEGLWAKQRNSVVQCFDCKATQDITSAATSTTCPKCSAHLDLRDYKITSSFSRAIRTHGDIHVTARGDLSSSNVVCRSAVIEGKLRSNLHCAETCTVSQSGRIPGRLSANHLLVERKADVQFFRTVRVKSIEIRGHMVGEVVAETVVVIHRNASLDGNVTAKSISVEKGGMFTGQLIIGSSGLQQAELLPATPETPAKAAPSHEDETLPGIVPPLPAS
ncbi:MAG: polymer-forming cytoskeletal protein [Chthoniobacterales bacterium]